MDFGHRLPSRYAFLLSRIPDADGRRQITTQRSWPQAKLALAKELAVRRMAEILTQAPGCCPLATTNWLDVMFGWEVGRKNKHDYPFSDPGACTYLQIPIDYRLYNITYIIIYIYNIYISLCVWLSAPTVIQGRCLFEISSGCAENCQAMWTKVSWKHEDVSDRDFLRNREEYVALLILVYLCHFMIFYVYFHVWFCVFLRPGDWISIYFHISETSVTLVELQFRSGLVRSTRIPIVDFQTLTFPCLTRTIISFWWHIRWQSLESMPVDHWLMLCPIPEKLLQKSWWMDCRLTFRWLLKRPLWRNVSILSPVCLSRLCIICKAVPIPMLL